jgi:ABC-type lipoprotein release transport system permease subunit
VRLGILAHCVAEALSSLRRERRRLMPMTLGIVWGMATVMVLLAVAAGFEESQRRVLGAYGDRFVLLRLNRAELDRAAGKKEPRLKMEARDVERLRVGAPAIRRLSPMNMAHRARITGQSGAGADVTIAGALPELAQIRNLPLAEGRFHNELDEEQRRRVIVLGPVARRQLFGRGPAVGQTVRVAGFSTSAIPTRLTTPPPSSASRRGANAQDAARPPAGVPSSATAAARSGSRSSGPPGASGSSRSSSPSSSSSGGGRAGFSAPAAPTTSGSTGMQGQLFEVIGVLKDVEIQRESYVSVARMAFVPFSTSTAVFDLTFSTMLIEPRSIEDRDLALRQFREVMGARYGFSPSDRNAVVIYFDAIERARMIAQVFGALRLFLAGVGALILAIGAIGVMNVVLVSVAARRYEIGLRKALGATPLAIYAQFFVETLSGCALSGLLGFLLGGGGILLLSSLPLPEGFSRPVLDLRTAGVAFGLLAAIAIAAAAYPARRAARLPPVEALRSRA